MLSSYNVEAEQLKRIMDYFDNGTSFICKGDFDGDGDMDGSELAVLAADFGRTDCDQGEPCEGDFDKDADVDGFDLAVFAANFGRTGCLAPLHGKCGALNPTLAMYLLPSLNRQDNQW